MFPWVRSAQPCRPLCSLHGTPVPTTSPAGCFTEMARGQVPPAPHLVSSSKQVQVKAGSVLGKVTGQEAGLRWQGPIGHRDGYAGFWMR